MCRVCCRNRKKAGREADSEEPWLVALCWMKLGACLLDSQDYLMGGARGGGGRKRNNNQMKNISFGNQN